MKGGGSATYGAGAVGGVINLIPHQASEKGIDLEAEVSENGQSTSASADWASADNMQTSTVFAQVDSLDAVDDDDGFTEVSEKDLLTVGGRFEQYLLGSTARLVAEANWTQAQRRGGDLVSIDRRPEESMLTEAADTKRVGFSLAWLHQPSSRLDYRLTASLADTRRDSYYGGGFDPNAYGTTDNPLWIVDAQANRILGDGTITVGGQYLRDSLDDAQPGYDRFVSETRTSGASSRTTASSASRSTCCGEPGSTPTRPSTIRSSRRASP